MKPRIFRSAPYWYVDDGHRAGPVICDSFDVALRVARLVVEGDEDYLPYVGRVERS